MSIIESANGVGARLAEARSDQSLSVEDLSSRTYIRPAVIRGIEHDDFGPCGGPFYARGHIRTLARTLGIDDGPLLAEFDRQHGPSEPRLGPETTTAEPAGLRPAKVRRRASGNGGPGWMAVATVVLIVICVVALVSLVVGGPSKNNGTTPAARPSAASAAPSTAPRAAAPVAPRVYSGVNLAVRIANGDSWVRVTDENGRVLASSVGKQGLAAEFRGAQSLRVTFGNAASIAATCNGKALGSLGGQGQVVSRVLVLGDPACGAATG